MIVELNFTLLTKVKVLLVSAVVFPKLFHHSVFLQCSHVSNCSLFFLTFKTSNFVVVVSKTDQSK